MPALRMGEHAHHERRLARAGHARHRRQAAGGEGDVDALQVVQPRVAHADEAGGCPTRRLPRGWLAAQPRARGAARAGGDLLGRALCDDAAAHPPAAGPQVDHMVGGADDVQVVLDDEHGVALLRQAAQQRDQSQRVAGVQADGRLVQHDEQAGHAGVQRRAQAQPLRLAARERVRRPRGRQIAESQARNARNLGVQVGQIGRDERAPRMRMGRAAAAQAVDSKTVPPLPK